MLPLYGLGGLSKRFAGRVARPLAGIGLGAEGALELSEETAGVPLMSALVGGGLLRAAGGGLELRGRCRRGAELVVSALARPSADLRAGG